MAMAINVCKPVLVGKSARAFNGETQSSSIRGKADDFTLPRKSSKENLREPYHKPTQVDEDEYPKALERTLVKELGKLTP